MRIQKIVSAILVFVLMFTIASPLAFAGTEVSGGVLMVETVNTIDPAYCRVGDNVKFIVTNDFYVNGKVIIKAGSEATGVVTHAKDNGMLGMAGEIGVKVTSVKAVDGTILSVTGEKAFIGKDNTMTAVLLSFVCILFLLMEGEEVSIPAGSQLDARIVGSYNLNI